MCEFCNTRSSNNFDDIMFDGYFSSQSIHLAIEQAQQQKATSVAIDETISSINRSSRKKNNKSNTDDDDDGT